MAIISFFFFKWNYDISSLIPLFFFSLFVSFWRMPTKAFTITNGFWILYFIFENICENAILCHEHARNIQKKKTCVWAIVWAIFLLVGANEYLNSLLTTFVSSNVHVYSNSNVHALNIGFACMGAIFNGFSVMPKRYWIHNAMTAICWYYMWVCAWLMYTCLVLVSISTPKAIVKTKRMHKPKGIHENQLTLYRLCINEIWKII